LLLAASWAFSEVATRSEVGNADSRLNAALRVAINDYSRRVRADLVGTANSLAHATSVQQAFQTRNRAALVRLARTVPDAAFYINDQLVAGEAPGGLHVERSSSVFNEDGALIGRIIIVREITAARVAEREAADLKAAERLKSELVATVSHELRTPLTAVLGFVHLLMEHDLAEEERRRYLETVQREAQRLAELIDDFLDLRKIEAGQFTLAYDTFDLVALLRAQAELFGQQSESHTLEVDVPDQLSFSGDRKRLRQLIGNLLSNAIKYSPDGGVVALAATRSTDGVRISVRDHGIGIPADQQAHVFTEFFRVESKAMREIGGTGLGLSLCQEIAEAHGGRIRLESTAGEGSTFVVELPHAAERAEAA